ncbi:MAG: hypothetical protein LBB67_05045 [Oscillospiraceae bacterium]|jgi:hypothetical protein|nr:hypothetical protein [Oscillospiraceae bacterium]
MKRFSLRGALSALQLKKESICLLRVGFVLIAAIYLLEVLCYCGADTFLLYHDAMVASRAIAVGLRGAVGVMGFGLMLVEAISVNK